MRKPCYYCEKDKKSTYCKPKGIENKWNYIKEDLSEGNYLFRTMGILPKLEYPKCSCGKIAKHNSKCSHCNILVCDECTRTCPVCKDKICKACTNITLFSCNICGIFTCVNMLSKCIHDKNICKECKTIWKDSVCSICNGNELCTIPRGRCVDCGNPTHFECCKCTETPIRNNTYCIVCNGLLCLECRDKTHCAHNKSICSLCKRMAIDFTNNEHEMVRLECQVCNEPTACVCLLYRRLGESIQESCNSCCNEITALVCCECRSGGTVEVPRKLCKICLSDLCVHCRYSYDGMCKPCKERPDVHKCIQIYNKHFECICCGQKQKKICNFSGM